MPLEKMAAQLGLSELQFALTIIGALFFVWVLFYNLRHARRRDSFGIQSTSISEPVFNDPDISVENEIDASARYANHVPNTPIFLAIQPIDPRIDCVISLHFSEPILGSEIIRVMKEQENDGKPIFCEGLLDQQNRWEFLNPENAYSDLQMAIQLASRRGPLGVLEISDFYTRAQNISEALDAQIDMPSVSAMIDSAKELDAIAAASDIQLGINIIFDQNAPSWQQLKTTLEPRGFEALISGRAFVYVNQTIKVFSTSEIDPHRPVTQITLLLEVPKVAVELNAFDLMLSEASYLAETLQGRLVDDNGALLTEASVGPIRKQLQVIYTDLEGSGIVAGSITAQRLFS